VESGDSENRHELIDRMRKCGIRVSGSDDCKLAEIRL
jgi:hypothetical protein